MVSRMEGPRFVVTRSADSISYRRPVSKLGILTAPYETALSSRLIRSICNKKDLFRQHKSEGTRLRGDVQVEARRENGQHATAVRRVDERRKLTAGVGADEATSNYDDDDDDDNINNNNC